MNSKHYAVTPLALTVLGALFVLRAEAIGLQVVSDSITRVSTTQVLDAGIRIEASVPGLDIRHNVTAGGVLVSGRIASAIGPALLIGDGVQVTSNINPAIRIAGEVIGQILNQNGQLSGTAPNAVAIDFRDATGNSRLDFVQTGDGAVTTGSILGRAGSGDKASFLGGNFTGEQLIVDALEVSTAVDTVRVTGAGGLTLPKDTTVIYAGDHNAPADPLIDVTNTLTAEPDTVISAKAANIAAQQAITTVGNKTVVVARAANIVGDNNIGVSSASVLLNIAKSTVGNELRVVLTPKSLDAIYSDVVQAGASTNQAQAYTKAFDAVMAAGTGTLSDKAFTTLNVNSSAVAAVAAAVAPDDSNAIAQISMNMGQLAMGNIVRHLGEGQSLDAYYQPKSYYYSKWKKNKEQGAENHNNYDPERGGIWGRLLGRQGRKDSHNGFSGYKTNIKGLTLGADTGFDRDRVVGGALTYGISDLNSDQPGRATETTSYLGTLYGGLNTNYGFANAMLTYGFGKHESRKRIGGEKITGDYNAHQWGLNFQTGMNVPLGETWSLRPLTELNWQTVKFDKYKEKGSTGLEQEIEQDRYSVLETGVGFDLKGNMAAGDSMLVSSVKLMGWYNFIDKKSDVDARYLVGGDVYSASGPRRKRWRYQAGVGVDYIVNDDVSVELDYTHDWASGFKSDSVSLKLRYDF